MGMLCEFEEKFMDIISSVLAEDLSTIDAHELGEVVDCLKDIEEAKYYKAVTEAMEEKNSDSVVSIDRSRMYYHEPDDEITFETVMQSLNDLATEATADEKATMRQKLIVCANKLV